MTELDENFENEYNPRIKKILFIGFAILYIRLCGIYKNKPLVIDDVMKEAYRIPVRQDKSEDKSEDEYEDEYYSIELITDRINITVNNIIKDSYEINQKEYIKTVEFLLYNFDLEKTTKIITAIKKIITEIKNDDDDDNIQKKKGNSVVPQPLSSPSAAPSSYSGSLHTPFFSSGSGSTPPMMQQPYGYSQNSTNYHPSNGIVERGYVVGGKKIRKNKVI